MTDARAARVIITGLLFALGLSFLYATRATLIAFLFAIFFAYLMSPIVAHLEKFLKARGLAIAVIYTLLIALVVVFFVLVGPKATREGARLGVPGAGAAPSAAAGRYPAGPPGSWPDRRRSTPTRAC